MKNGAKVRVQGSVSIWYYNYIFIGMHDEMYVCYDIDSGKYGDWCDIEEMPFEPEKGETINVWNNDKGRTHRTFIQMLDGKYLCNDAGDPQHYYAWNNAEEC